MQLQLTNLTLLLVQKHQYDSTEHNPSEANSRSAAHEITRF
jgi:hypothetical protein